MEAWRVTSRVRPIQMLAGEFGMVRDENFGDPQPSGAVVATLTSRSIT